MVEATGRLLLTVDVEEGSRFCWWDVVSSELECMGT